MNFSGNFGENQRYLEQIAVQLQLQLTVLDLHQTLGNVQAQTAAFAVTGGIAPDKALHQLVGRNVQGGTGSITEERFLN